MPSFDGAHNCPEKRLGRVTSLLSLGDHLEDGPIPFDREGRLDHDRVRSDVQVNLEVQHDARNPEAAYGGN